MTMNIFGKATKEKVRFQTQSGTVTVEDLWDLPLQSKTNKVCLDDIAKQLHKEIKDSEEVSFVSSSSPKNSLLELKFDIVKHIIGVKVEENQKTREAIAQKQQREQILSILAEKESESLKNKSIEELKAMLG